MPPEQAFFYSIATYLDDHKLASSCGTAGCATIEIT